MSLFEIGFEKGVLVEAIVSTYCPDNSPYAAAMGCQTKDGETLLLRPFTNTQTYKNLLSRKSLVVNITHDPELFYKVVFGEELGFEKSRKVDAPVVKDACAWIEATVLEMSMLYDGRAEVRCDVKHVEALPTKPRPYSRAEHALI